MPFGTDDFFTKIGLLLDVSVGVFVSFAVTIEIAVGVRVGVAVGVRVGVAVGVDIDIQVGITVTVWLRVRDVAPIERSDQVASEECQHRYRRQKESKLPTSISHPTAIVPDRSAIDRLSTPLWDRGIVLRKNRSTRRTITTGN